MPFLIICWMRVTEATQEFWRYMYYNNTGVADAVLPQMSTKQHWVLGGVLVHVASGVSYVQCNFYYKTFVIKPN